jgi:hypothetical protein
MTRTAPVDRLREREIDEIHSIFPQIDRQTIATVHEQQQGIPNAVFACSRASELAPASLVLHITCFGCGRAHGECC